MKTFKKLSKCDILLFLIGGTVYNLIEILWRGRTHWSMFILGGICFKIIGRIAAKEDAPFIKRCVLCSVYITAAELLCGIIVNKIFKMNVWDYSELPLNFKGQICALFSFFWMLLSIPAMPLYRKAESLIEIR